MSIRVRNYYSPNSEVFLLMIEGHEVHHCSLLYRHRKKSIAKTEHPQPECASFPNTQIVTDVKMKSRGKKSRLNH